MTTEAITEADPEVVEDALPDAAPAAPGPEPEAKKVEEDDEPKVLDLTTLAPTRRLVKLPTVKHPKGENFELRLLDDFGIAEQQQLLSRSRRFEQLFNKEEDLESDEQERLKYLLDWVFDRVLDCPEKIKQNMPDAVRSRVVTGFSLAPLLARQEEAVEQQKKDVFARLVKQKLVTQEQLDKVVEELEEESQTSES